MGKRRAALLPAMVLACAVSFGLAACGSFGSGGEASTPPGTQSATPGAPASTPAVAADDDTPDPGQALFCATYKQVSPEADWKNVGTRDLEQEKAKLDKELVTLKQVVPPDVLTADWTEVMQVLGQLDHALGTAIAGGDDPHNELEAVIDTLTNDQDFIDAQSLVASFGYTYCGSGGTSDSI